MKGSGALSLNRLKKAGLVRYKKVSLNNVQNIKRIFSRVSRSDIRFFEDVPSSERFIYFYVWYVYFKILPWKSFVRILNTLKQDRLLELHRVTRNEKRYQDIVFGGVVGLISGLVALVAGFAAKASATVATTAAIVGTSTAASTVASSALGGVAGALAVAGTEALINA